MTQTNETAVERAVRKTLAMVALAIRDTSADMRADSDDVADSMIGLAESIEERTDVMVRDVSRAALSPSPAETDGIREAVLEERKAIVKWLRREGPADKDMHTWRYCQDMLAITIERGEHHE